MPRWSRLLLVLVLTSAPAWAQVELVDPDAPKLKQPKPKPPPPEDEAEPEPTNPINTTDTIEDEPPTREPIKAPAAKFDAGRPLEAAARPDAGPGTAATPTGKKPDGKKPPEPPPAMVGPALPPAQLVVSTVSDADLLAAWTAWRTANASGDLKAEAAARAALVTARIQSGATDLEPYAQGLLRAALAHEKAGDSGGAIDLGNAAATLAPGVPTTWLGLARVYATVDPTSAQRIFDALKSWALKTVEGPRWRRPVIADVVAALLTALCALSVVVVVVLFTRGARLFFYDFHFLFPRALARWQSTTIAVLLLSLPLVFRLGVAPMLLVLSAAVALYLEKNERVVALVLISFLGAVPVLGALAVHFTSFAGTPAETASLLDQGGPGTEPLAAQWAKVAADEKLGASELNVLGRWELRRGQLEPAITHLKASLLKKPNDARAQVNLGVAMALTGDLENPRGLFEDAAKNDRSLAIPLVDLSRLYFRRVAVLGSDAVAAEVDKANVAIGQAHSRDLACPDARPLAAGDKLPANAFLVTLPLASEQLAALAVVPEAEDRVRTQLSRSLVGDLPEPIAPFFPLAVSLLIFGLGALGSPLNAARACTKCGGPVSSRGDPEVVPRSTMCTQCVNVFSRKGVVPTAFKVRKQLEVARYETRQGRISYAFGLACSGMGHIFSGLVVRGAIYGFLFLLVIVLFVQRNGVLRAPYEWVPDLVRLVPLGLAFALVYLLTLRGLYKRQS